MYKFDYSNITDMNSLVEKLRNLDEIAILGNGVSMLDIDLKKLDQIVTIGVNHIEMLYVPNILLWVDRYKDRLGDIVDGKAPLKVCRIGAYKSDIPGLITFPAKKSDPFGHKWIGRLKNVGSFITAIHLAMVCVKNIYLLGCDYSEDAHFYKYVDKPVYQDKSDESRGVNFRDTRSSMITYLCGSHNSVNDLNTDCNIFMCSEKSKIKCFSYSDRFNK